MKRSPLHAFNEGLGARFVGFGGWDMPVQYTGVLAEHKIVRTSAGLFDVSHLGRFACSGAGATDLVRHQLCNDITLISPGRAQYTMALNDAGGVVDDIIVWRWADESYWVMPNGANYEEVLDRFRAAAPDSVTVEPRQDRTALMALQGPDASDVATAVLGATAGRFRVLEAEFQGTPVWMAGTGYTGERGIEVAVANDRAADLADAFLGAGAAPCGLGARDTLRLEMGYPLWGQDLDRQTTPLEAGLDWVVGWDHDFIGKDALQRQRADGLPKRLVSFVMSGREIARHGYPMRSGPAAGVVASGNYSPGLERGIGMGYLSPDPGGLPDEVEVEVRGNWVAAVGSKTPFIGD